MMNNVCHLGPILLKIHISGFALIISGRNIQIKYGGQMLVLI